jgi:hypothetical protein
MSDNEKLKEQPWFRNPMVWMVIFFPSLAVVAGMITIVIAVNTEDGLVVDDYYKKGLQINQVIYHDQMARDLGLSALVDTNSQSGEIRVSLTARKEINLTEEITFKLIHRTRSGLDQITVLSRIDNSADYRGYIKPPIIEGRWTILISAEKEWRLKKDFTTRSAEHILINIIA